MPNMLATVGKGGYGYVVLSPFLFYFCFWVGGVADGCNRCFLIYGSFCYCMSIFASFLILENKGPSLERIDDLFGVTELVKNIEEERRGKHAHAPPTEIGFGGKETSKATHKENVNELRNEKNKEEAKEEKVMEGDAIVREME